MTQATSDQQREARLRVGVEDVQDAKEYLARLGHVTWAEEGCAA
jgi:hypothetical protein